MRARKTYEVAAALFEREVASELYFDEWRIRSPDEIYIETEVDIGKFNQRERRDVAGSYDR